MEPIVFKYKVEGGGSLSVHSDGSITGSDHEPKEYLTCVENNFQQMVSLQAKEHAGAVKSVDTDRILNHVIYLSIQRNISLPEATERVLQTIDKIIS